MTTKEKTTAKQALLNMFTEPVAKHFLDSGSHYGYRFEQNQKRDLLNEKLISLDDGMVTVNTAKYLIEYLEFDFDDVTDYINEVIADQEWHWVDDVNLLELEFIYPEIETLIETFNTYNSDSYLDTVLIGKFLKINDEYYTLLQVHGGCDVRGGYTDVKCFKTDYCIDSLTTIIGIIDGKEVSNMYDGYNLTFEGDDTEVDLDSLDLTKTEIGLDIMPNSFEDLGY